MQHGLLSSLLLSTSLLLSPVGIVNATEMSPHTVESWLENDQVKLKTAELLELVVRDEVNSLRFALEARGGSLPTLEEDRTAKNRTHTEDVYLCGATARYYANLPSIRAW